MKLTIKSRLALLIILLLALLLVVGGLGINGMQTSNRSLEGVYENNLIRSQDLARIDGLVRNIMMQLFLASQHAPELAVSALHDHPVTMHMEIIEDTQAELAGLWGDYRKAITSAEGRASQGSSIRSTRSSITAPSHQPQSSTQTASSRAPILSSSSKGYRSTRN